MREQNPIIEEDCADILRAVNFGRLRNKKVLLTGATGLLGQYIFRCIVLANKLNGLNCHLTCVNLHGPSKDLRHFLPDKRIVFKRVDLSKPFHIKGKFDYIFHAAGYGQPAKFIKDPAAVIGVNVEATRNLLEVAKRSRGVIVFFSSAEVYGDIPSQLRAVSEEHVGSSSPFQSRAIYREAKILGESLCYFFRTTHGVNAKIVRISHVYGPGISIADKRVLSDFIRKGLRHKKITLLDDGSAIKTYGYVADVVKMIVHVALLGKGTVYNVGGTDSISIKKLAGLVGKNCNVPVLVPKKKSRLSHVGHEPRYVRLNLKKILKEMKKLTLTSIIKGIGRTVAWNKAEFGLK